MGKTALILVAAFAITVGLYTVGIKKVDKGIQTDAAVESYRVQAAEIAKSGIHMAVSALQYPALHNQLKAGQRIELLNKPLFEGELDYIIDNSGLPEDYARVTSTGDFKGHQATYVAVIRRVGSGNVGGKVKNRWAIDQASEHGTPLEIANEEDQELLDLINEKPPLPSHDLMDELKEETSLSSTVLIAAIDRNPPMVSVDLKDVLLYAKPLSASVLERVALRRPSMSSSDNKDVLIASSPLPANILEQVIAGNPPMTAGDLQAVLDAQPK